MIQALLPSYTFLFEIATIFNQIFVLETKHFDQFALGEKGNYDKFKV